MNIFLLRGVLVSFVIFFIAFQSCNKDTSLTKVKTLDPTEQKILNFREKIRSGEKSEETMSIEDAVWNIEATLNYSHSNFESNEVVRIDSVFIPIDINDAGDINFDNVINAYNQLNSDLLNILGDNSMRIADVEFIETENKSGEEQLKLIVVETKGLPQISTTFGSTDYWKPMWEAGKCDVYEGQGIGDDAKTKIQKKINMLTISLPDGYATDVETIYAGAYNSGEDNYFWQGYDSDCLNPTEMNYWLGKGKEIAEIKRPSNKKLLSSNYFWDAYGGGGNTWYYHMANFSYGIWHSTTPPINDN